jgi:PKD repeat protein
MSEHSEETDESKGLLPLERRTYLLSLAAGATASGGAAGGAVAASSASQDEPAGHSNHDYPNSWVGYGRGEYGAGLYGDPAPPALDGYEGQPQDVDGDDLFEDIDGDGEFTIFDVQALFNEIDSNGVQNYAPFFDFAEDGEISVFDVQALFNKLQTTN